MRSETDPDVVRAAMKVPYMLDVCGLGWLELMPSEAGEPSQTIISWMFDHVIRALPTTVSTDTFMNAQVISMSINGLNSVAYVCGSKNATKAKLLLSLESILYSIDEFDKLCSLTNTLKEVSSI
jgi:hypothetical protein